MSYHVLRMRGDNGEVVAEWESESVWRIAWLKEGENSAMVCYGSGGQAVYPPAHLIMETLVAEGQPA